MSTPPVSRARQIATEAQRRIQGLPGMVPGAVQWGQMPSAGQSQIPCAWMGLRAVETEHAPEMGRYKRSFTIEIAIQVAGEDHTAASRIFAALDMASAAASALERGRSEYWGLEVIDLDVTHRAINGDEWGATGCGVALIAFSCYWFADSGEGL